MKHQVISSTDEWIGAPPDTSAARQFLLLGGFMIMALGLVGCGAGEPPARQAPPVTVGTPTVATVYDYEIFTGYSRAVESADVMARVAGTLETVDFEASSQVKKGDLLFTIEKTKYQALRDAAEAGRQSAKADLLRAETELTRMEKASENQAVSEVDVDRARADRDMAIAAVSLAEANLAEAELNFSYTDVVSPIDGLVSRRLVDAGNLVGQGGPTRLTRVNKQQPIYVYFYAPESGVLQWLADRPDGEGEENQVSLVKAQVALANESGFPRTGEIDYVDNEVDATTGTIEMRVVLPNDRMQIFPGLFVRVKVAGKKIPDAVQVPEVAVGTDLGGKYVLVVGENDIVEQKYVTLGKPQEEGLVHIKDGLEGTETIIVNGLVFARPGLPVMPLTPEQFEAMQNKAAQK